MVDLSNDKNKDFMKMLVGLGSYLDDIDESLVKRFKLSLKFYSVTHNVKVAKEVYESTNNIPDILENLVNNDYITVDNVELLEAIINPSLDETRHEQLYHHTLDVIKEYKKLIALCDMPTKVECISVASLPINSQYMIVSTGIPAEMLNHKYAEEVGDSVFSALALPRLYSHLCGYEEDPVKLWWNLHEDCLKDYHLEVPDYDHYQLLINLGVSMIEVINGSDYQFVNLLRLFDYIGCLLLPRDRSTTNWVAYFLCVPTSYGNILSRKCDSLIKVQLDVVECCWIFVFSLSLQFVRSFFIPLALNHLSMVMTICCH